MTHRGQASGILRAIDQGVGQRFVVTFFYENTADVVFNGFWNSTVPRRENRQPGRHRFQHRIRYAFLVSVGARLARMQKKMRRIEKLPQFFLRNETGEID